MQEVLFEQLFIQLLRQIDLVHNRDRAVACRACQHEHILVADGLGAVEHSQDERGSRSLRHRPVNARLLHRIVRVAQTGGVGHAKQNLSDLDILLDEIAGRARNIGHNRPLAAEQRVQQRGLAGVRPSEDNARYAFSKNTAALIAFCHAVQTACRAVQQRRGVLEQHRINVLVREIHDRVEMRHHAEQLIAHLLHGRADRAHDLCRRILRRLCGARGDQIMHGFSLRKAHFAV